MQRYRRPEGYKPNTAPFARVTVWDRCGCGWIERAPIPGQDRRAMR
jgi:hypothetical protein